MKKALLLMLFTFTTITSCTTITSDSEEVLTFPFTLDSRKSWRYISDRVMGGVSDGQVSLEQEEGISFVRLTGNVSTKNRGGFIQLNSSSSLFNKPLMFQSIRNSEKDGKKLQGVRLNVRGNGETYYIFIKTNETKGPSDYYRASFETNSNWEMIELPFNQFVRKRSNFDGSDTIINSKLYPKNIRSFGIIAYGRDFTSDVSVSTVNFYY